MILFLLIGVVIIAPTILRAGPCATAASQLPPSAHGIGVVKTEAGECIGISDGTVAFDIKQPGRTDSDLKQQAANELAGGDKKDAIKHLQQAVEQDSGDAEALIYMQDQWVLKSGQPYITFIVGTKITGDQIGLTGERAKLQGAYIEQQEHNKSCTYPQCTLVLLLIANTGNDPNNAQLVAQQIVQAAKYDHTIIGIEGWSVSQDSYNIVNSLKAAKLPIVSASASSDWLTGISPYFFRVSPPDSSQGALGASYAMSTLNAHRIALFEDSFNAYSASLADAFKQHVISGSVVVVQKYAVGNYTLNKEIARANLQDVLSYHPDLIYFAGYSEDAAILLKELQTYKQLAQMPVMGGDALYDLVDSGQNVVGLDRLVFTAFASPNEWQYRAPSVQEPLFFQEYAQTFASGGLHSDGVNGDNSPSGGAILSYDAMRVLLQASQTAKAPLTGASLQQALTNITGPQAFQGVSGQIAFGPDGNPQDKAVVILNVDKQGKAHILGVDGTFLLP